MSKVKIRIAVAITPDGKWNSCGWSEGDDEELMGMAADPLGTGEARYWINTEVEVPETVEITVTASREPQSHEDEISTKEKS